MDTKKQKISKDLQIKNLQPTDKITRHYVEGPANFYIEVSPKGRKTWRIKLAGAHRSQSTVTIGHYPQMGLQTARRTAEDLRTKNRGVDLAKKAIAHQPSPETINFRQAAKNYYEANLPIWSFEHSKDVKAYLAELCDGKYDTAQQNLGFGDVYMSELRYEMIIAIIRGAIHRGSFSVAKDLCDYARVVIEDFNSENTDEVICKVNVNQLRLFKSKKIKKPPVILQPALEEHLLPEFLARFELYCRASIKNKLAAQLLLLTGVRTNNILEMKYEEIDFDKKMWFIPSKGTSKNPGHVVPLSRQAFQKLSFLKEQRKKLSEDDLRRLSPYVFYGDKKETHMSYISENTIMKSIKELGYQGQQTGHGFRANFSTWAYGQLTKKGLGRWTQNAIEMYLMHYVKEADVSGRYNRNEYIDERIELAQAWADQIDEWIDEGKKKLFISS
jgi:integrase